MTAELNFDLLKHPAVQAVQERRSRAQKDMRKLDASVAENERIASEKRQELGRAEVAVSMGDEPETPVDDLKAKLKSAEAAATAAREEIQRRQGAMDDREDMEAALRKAAAELTEAADPAIRDLTEQYVELVARAYEIEKGLTAIYSQIENGNRRARVRHETRRTIQTPHTNPALGFRTNPKKTSYDKAMDDYFRSYRGLGYDV